MSGHVAPKSSYIAVFLALMVGTALTVGVTYVDLGAFNLTVALAIAVTKAMLVILYFMHLKYSPKLIKVTFGAGFFFFLIMIVITLSDYLSPRPHGHAASSRPPASAPSDSPTAVPLSRHGVRRSRSGGAASTARR